MSDNVIQLPPATPKVEWLIGPVECWPVVVEGREIPRLDGRRLSSGRILLMVDKRFMAEFDEDDARQAAWLIAQATAVAEGYSHLGATTKESPFAPQVAFLDPPPGGVSS